MRPHRSAVISLSQHGLHDLKSFPDCTELHREPLRECRPEHCKLKENDLCYEQTHCLCGVFRARASYHAHGEGLAAKVLQPCSSHQVWQQTSHEDAMIM